ncbi:hypothetical protein AALP_AA3G068700 [Arabis alpina]|uniref:Acidic protein n=1 Tax=Arabis alpina TaxID=50452 RepID=A0A087H7J2_ARAAL|nr:hypothetical protein AALP_AA3G068700 [Arabis alpina]
MESKTVVLSVLIMSLVMANIQVEGFACCPTDAARDIFSECTYSGKVWTFCASLSGCQLNRYHNCPPGYTHGILENSGDAANEYCKLGCVSSVCGDMTTFKNSDASEIMNGAVKKCIKTCSNLCTKGSVTAFQTA